MVVIKARSNPYQFLSEGLSVVSWGWLVDWGWLVGSFWGWSVVWDSFVGNLGNISGVSISGSVGDSLDTAIWKSYSVRSRGGVTVTLFVLVEVSLAVVISYGVFVSVYWRSIFVYWSFAVSWSWGMVWSWSSWEGSGNSEGSKECNKGLDRKEGIGV